ncbi:23S rRNA (guanosine(2251)-2'-O)-methyltransferase RlmB [bacterium]|nr:MAG: 23S rRNA (guanosine(2251)-2'-O)-methyltransferase RlmB [bacterium]
MSETESTEYIYGRRAVFEVLRGGRKVYKIFGTPSALDWLSNKIKSAGVIISAEIESANKQKLHNLVHRADNQGLVAIVEKFIYTPLQIILDRAPKIILLADEITDPQNLGAMIRSSNLCGVGAVIIPQQNSAKITPVVVHTSAGATEHIPIARVKSIPHCIHLLAEREYFILGTDKPRKNTISIVDFKPSGKIGLIMGSEGEGISRKILQKCHHIISIPQAGEIDSFNVSVATGIILFQLASKMNIFC